MRVFLYTLFLSVFIGISLYTSVWYTKAYLEPVDPLKSSIEVGHLENLFAEKVSDNSLEQSSKEKEEEDDWGWKESDIEPSANSAEIIDGGNRVSTANTNPNLPEAKEKKKPTGVPRGKTDKNVFDFGSIDAGDVITHYFSIQNKGTAPLRITDFEVGCGCTMVNFPRTAIQVGKSVKIKAVFDSKDKFGAQNKLLRLVTNGTPKNLDIYFKGYVYPKDFGKTKGDAKAKALETAQPANDSLKKSVSG